MSILIFFVVLFVLVLVHEWGHFIVAKKTGMRVDEFGIGFPPKLFGKKRGETEYTFNALPIGGFVRILGENGDEDSEELSEADKKRTFSARPRWAQALVLIAGVAMNVLFAWFLLAIVHYVQGVELPMDTAVVENVLSDGPAAQIPVGAEIASISAGEREIKQPLPAEFSAFVTDAASSPLTIEYIYQGAVEAVEITSVQGLSETNPELFLVGIVFEAPERETVGVVGAIIQGLKTTGDMLRAIMVGVWTLISGIFTGNADLSNIGGPIMIATMTGDVAAVGIVALLNFTAFISLNLAVINLLPIPALDGGRLVFVAIEAITRRPIPPEWAGRMNLAGFALLMLLMIAVTYSDIVKLL